MNTEFYLCSNVEYPARQFALWNDQLVKIFFTKSVEIHVLQCFKYILDLDLIWLNSKLSVTF